MTTFILGTNGLTLHNQKTLVGKHLWGGWKNGRTTQQVIADINVEMCFVCGQAIDDKHFWHSEKYGCAYATDNTPDELAF